jgi:hypothetical protein
MNLAHSEPTRPEIGQDVEGMTLLGSRFKGTVMVLGEPMQGSPTVKVAVLRHDYLLLCYWYADASQLPAVRWQSCWPAKSSAEVRA